MSFNKDILKSVSIGTNHCFHNESPRINTRGDLPDGAPSDGIIDRGTIGDYSVSVEKRYGMASPGDILLYAKDMFAEL